MKKQKQDHIINALATYICISAIRDNQILCYVPIDDIAKQFDATGYLKEKAYLKARQLLRDFY